jgi:channel protein (hemolysin III family)
MAGSWPRDDPGPGATGDVRGMDHPRLAERPRLRGALHLLGFIVAAAAGPILVAATGWRWPVAVYAASLALMLGVSAAYHRGPWSPAVRRWWQRADHAAIFVFIAGTYTPLGAIAMPASSGHPLLAVVWVGAALGVLRALAWPHAPRWIAASLYVVLGWSMVIALPAVLRAHRRAGPGRDPGRRRGLHDRRDHLRAALARSVAQDLRLPRGLPRP